MKKILAFLFFLAICAVSFGQSFDLKLQNRDSWTYKADPDGRIDDVSGFRGDRLCLRFDSKWDENWSMSIRQHLNRGITNRSLFNATDWIYLQYKANERWSFLAGKWMVEYGGHEYYADPIDVLFAGEYFNNYNCFLFGLSASWHFNEGNDALTLQLSQSPFCHLSEKPLYAYNLSWRGAHGIYEPLFSTNLFECPDGTYSAHLSLGNKLSFGPAYAVVDLMFRSEAEDIRFGDYSISSELGVDLGGKVSVFAKFTRDCNPDSDGDLLVVRGTDVNIAGAGIEYFPFKGQKDVRLHCLYARSFGSSAVTSLVQPDVSTFSIGLTLNHSIFHK